jgi:hypothetical protein
MISRFLRAAPVMARTLAHMPATIATAGSLLLVPILIVFAQSHLSEPGLVCLLGTLLIGIGFWTRRQR